MTKKSTGRNERQGWQFGREAHESDFYAIVKTIQEIDHISKLEITQSDTKHDLETVKKTNRFLMSSGNHKCSIKTQN